MIKPSVNDLSQNKYNRYVLCVASSKCARIITENSEDSETIGKEVIANEKTELPPEAKPIISAIHKLYEGKFVIKLPEEQEDDTVEDNASDETDSDESAEEQGAAEAVEDENND